MKKIIILLKNILFKYKILTKNAFDYFIKIRNFENEEIQFCYPNTILKMKKFNFLSKYRILKNERI